MIWQRNKSGMILAAVIALVAGASLDAAAEPTAGTALAGTSAAADSQRPSDLAREGMAKMLEAFNKFVESVPQYELPQLNENGDIILRRKRPEPAPHGGGLPRNSADPSRPI